MATPGDPSEMTYGPFAPTTEVVAVGAKSPTSPTTPQETLRRTRPKAHLSEPPNSAWHRATSTPLQRPSGPLTSGASDAHSDSYHGPNSTSASESPEPSTWPRSPSTSAIFGCFQRRRVLNNQRQPGLRKRSAKVSSQIWPSAEDGLQPACEGPSGKRGLQLLHIYKKINQSGYDLGV